MSDAESVADTVRRAAALLRKRAEAATDGPWWREDFAVHAHEVAYTAWTGDGSNAEANAEYIAGLHPDVALLIADSWQKTAAVMDETESVRVAVLTGDLGEDRPTVISGAGWRHHDWTATLAAARAVLGETT
jgi:hypothetical protein